MNIKFGYLYRDGSNYKKFGEVNFPNPSNIPLEEIESCIKKHLIDGEWFYAGPWPVPDLHFDSWDPEDDHLFHEFHFVEQTEERPTSDITIDAFLEKIEKAKIPDVMIPNALTSEELIASLQQAKKGPSMTLEQAKAKWKKKRSEILKKAKHQI